MRHSSRLRRRLELRHLIVVVSALIAAAPVRADEPVAAAKPRVLLVPYRVDPKIPVEPDVANAILATRLSKVKAFSIISQEELAQMAGYQAMLQGLGEDDVDGLRKLGEMARADRLVSGTLGDVGGTVAATLVLLNVQTGEIEKRVGGTAKGQRDLIIPLLNQQADAILAHLLRAYAPEKLGSATVPPPRRTPAPPAAPEPSLGKRIVMPLAALSLASFTGALGAGIAALGSAGLVAVLVPTSLMTSEGRIAVSIMAAGGAGALAWALLSAVVMTGLFVASRVLT